ncbi:MAG: helix-turn-helix domain-containing protein [Methylocella sp.]
MSTKDILNKIDGLPEGPSDIPHVPPPELIGFCVRWERGLQQWKRSTLADFACVSVSTIERVERGEKVSEEALDRIARGLGREPGYFTAPRYRLGPEQAVASLVETFGEMQPVAVAPMNTHRQVREAASCHAFLMHRPDVPEDYDADLANLTEWLDLACFVLSTKIERTSASERGRRDLYSDILGCIREIEKRGLTVLSGVMNAPQEGVPDWKVAVISVTPKLSDPGASKRRLIFVDRRLVAVPPCGPSEPYKPRSSLAGLFLVHKPVA